MKVRFRPKVKVHFTPKVRIHFMGIGGSGVSAVALLARSQGFAVSGCDLQESTPYLGNLKDRKIKTLVGHSTEHLKNIDILAVTPAAFFGKEKHPEISEAKRMKKLMTWQKFLGKFLHRGKKVICISGTHGKSTTTAMAGILMEEAGVDPNVMIGATVKEWKGNHRSGKSNIFLTESDEFYDNFLNYHPDIIVLNNIEFDHPDYFKSERQLFDSFKKHIKSLTGPKVLIFNQDSPGIKKLFELAGKKFLNKLTLHGYTTEDNPLIQTKASLFAQQISLGRAVTEFETKGVGFSFEHKFKLRVPGKYNVANALGVILLGNLLNLPVKKIQKGIFKYKGIDRRLEVVGVTKNKTMVYDDYAYHPTAIKVTLEALRQKYPGSRILTVVEPHSFSRTKALLSSYKDVFEVADKVIISPIYKSRDTKTYGVTGRSIVKVASHSNIKYFNSFEKIIEHVAKIEKPGDIIVVMGAGQSYEIARDIYAAIG